MITSSLPQEFVDLLKDLAAFQRQQPPKVHLDPQKRTLMVTWMEKCVICLDLKVLFFKVLHPLLERPLQQRKRLTEKSHERVLKEGLGVLSDSGLVRLMLNPIAFLEVRELLYDGSDFSDYWWKVMQECVAETDRKDPERWAALKKVYEKAGVIWPHGLDTPAHKKPEPVEFELYEILQSRKNPNTGKWEQEIRDQKTNERSWIIVTEEAAKDLEDWADYRRAQGETDSSAP